MKIIEPSAVIIRPQDETGGLTALRAIESMARISHKSEEMQTPDSYEKFLRAIVLGHGDYSVIEHASASVLFRVDRGITHELVRHRLFSFTQESTRFVNGRKSYPNGLEFIMPIGISSENSEYDVFECGCGDAESAYFKLLDLGKRPQEARSVLPNALASTIGMTGNFRSWRWFFLARTTRESHPDMRRVTIPLLEEFQKRIPILFEDIVPNARQVDNFSLPH